MLFIGADPFCGLQKSLLKQAIKEDKSRQESSKLAKIVLSFSKGDLG